MAENKKYEAELSDEELDLAAGGVANAQGIQKTAAVNATKKTLSASLTQNTSGALTKNAAAAAVQGNGAAAQGSGAATQGNTASTAGINTQKNS